MSRLTTHVLDTANGKPGSAVQLVLYKIVEGVRQAVVTTATNSDGRCEKPLLQGDEFEAGLYELDFYVGAYFANAGVELTQPPFLDVVTLRFGVADPRQHYHVPLVVSPWSYSTYRGS